MSPVSLNPLCPKIQHQSQLFISANHHESTSLSCCTFFDILDQSQTKDTGDLRHGYQEDGKLVVDVGSSSNNYSSVMRNSSSVLFEPKSIMADPNSACGHHNLSLYKIEDEESKSDYEYEKWMSSNVMFTRKKVSQAKSNLATNKALSITRVCADCNTTSTPLWRSGPNGPKSLCNACGIRQRKARRAMAEAANGTGFASSMDASCRKIRRVHHKEKKSRTNHFVRFKNRCKATTTAAAAGGTSQQQKVKINFKDFALNLRDNSALKQVFPMDEVAEAALLLMYLSTGFVYF